MIRPIRRRVFTLALVAALVLSLVPAVPASAVTEPTTIYVDAVTGDDVTGEGTEAAPFKSVTAAVLAAESGDTIVLADGTYSASETGESFPLELIETDISIIGDTWATLDGEGDSKVLMIVDSTVVMENVAIVGGFDASDGGAMLVLESTVSLYNVELSDNHASAGGAILVLGSTLDMVDSALHNNGEHLGIAEAFVMFEGCDTGGAILAVASEVTLADSAVYDNGALYTGAAIYSVGSTFTAVGSSFFGNEITGAMNITVDRSTSAASPYAGGDSVSALNVPMGDGGAIASFVGTVNVTDCGFYENTAFFGSSILGVESAVDISGSYFGGDYADDGVVRVETIMDGPPPLPAAVVALGVAPEPEIVTPSLTADSCVFEYNDALAVFVSRGVGGSISNSLFDNNDTSSGLEFELGGGPLIGLVDTPSFDVINVTTADNVLGHGAVWDNTGDVRVANCIIWDQFEYTEVVPTQIPDPISVWGSYVTDSDLMSLSEGDLMPVAIDEASVFSEDPMFADAAEGDYRLSADSPCVDAGSELAGDAPDHDLEGVDRPLDGDEDEDAAWDMGAFEYVSYASGRIAGENRFETSVAIAEEHFTSADTVVLATGRAFADGLAGSGLAGAYEAPILLTDSRVLPADVAAELVRLGISHVVLLGGEDAISTDVEAAIAALGDITVERIGGADRYETASMIADEIESIMGPAYLIFVARGDAFADALAASPVAYANAAPVLLVGPDELPDTTVGYIAAASKANTVIIGGTAAVSGDVEGDIKLAALGGVSRITGDDRYDTAAQVAQWAYDWGFADFGFVGVATGRDFADALSGGAGIGARGGVMVLTDPETVPLVTEDVISENAGDIDTLEVFGGGNAISDDVVDFIMGLLAG
ncbi:MAG: cell wall-binding repeat-containing protein [Coriobacteriia bacterium]